MKKIRVYVIKEWSIIDNNENKHPTYWTDKDFITCAEIKGDVLTISNYQAACNRGEQPEGFIRFIEVGLGEHPNTKIIQDITELWKNIDEYRKIIVEAGVLAKSLNSAPIYGAVNELLCSVQDCINDVIDENKQS